MFQDPNAGADVPAIANVVLPEIPQEPVQHMLFGSLGAVQAAIKHLHSLHYADPNDWSRPLPTGRANEVMAILTKKVRVD